MRLLHYSELPLEFDRDKKYARNGHHKPVGLWVSVEGDHDWPTWCEGEQFWLESLRNVSQVILSDHQNILVVDTLEKLDALNGRYHKGGSALLDLRGMDWDAVIKEHDGIIIAPYQWARRLEYMWYYGWDCASGVIWNLRAVKEVVPLALTEART